MKNTLFELILEKSNWCEVTEAADQCWKCPKANTDSAICKNALIADYLADNIMASQCKNFDVVQWIDANVEKPTDFISVLAVMTDAGLFPDTREAYTVNGEFFFPALSEFHPVSKWAYMPGNHDKK